jgi:hypothetical protein
MVSEQQPVVGAPVMPSPRVQAMHNSQGPTVDPALMAMVEQRHAPVQQVPAQERPMPPIQRAVEEYAQPVPEWHEAPRPHAAPVPEPRIEMPMPGYVSPIADSGGESFALPSRFAYYPFKDLYVSPFKMGHKAKLQSAAKQGSMQPVVEAVSTVIYSSDPQYKNLAFDLTLPDFWAVMHWLRLNSYTKMIFNHRDSCRNPEHLKKVKEGKLDEDSLLLRATINKTTLKTHELEYIPDPEVYKLQDQDPFYIAPPTMRDALDFLEHPLMRKPETRTEFAYLAQKASHLHGKESYVSIDERISWFERAPFAVGDMLDQFQAATKGYGVEEFIHMNCKVCGASRKSNIVLDASAFLSND